MRVAVDGEALRKLRLLHRRPQADLARAVGVDPVNLCHLERGRRQTVPPEVFVALVRELDIVERQDWLRPAGTVDIPGPRSGTASGWPSRTSSSTVSSMRTGSARTAAA